MLDVHAPEHGIGNAREFFIHLFTITCGLLIALGLEAGVEAMHHRHQRQEAEEKIRQEIRSNMETFKREYPDVLKERATLLQLVRTAEGIMADQPVDESQKLRLEFHEEEIPDAAWRTASSTGVLEYLPYDEVENFSDAYREQELVQSMEQQTLEDYEELLPEGSPKLTKDSNAEVRKETASEVRLAARRALGHLQGVIDAGAGAMESYEKALK